MEQSGASTEDSTPTRGRPKGPSALFSKSEIEDILVEAEKLSDPLELVEWAKSKSLVWLIVLDKLLFRAKGLNAVTQTANVVEKLIKHTEVMLAVPRESVQRSAPFTEREQEADQGQDGDSGDIGSLLKEAGKLFDGKGSV